jgi:hypothetical protein
LPMVVRAGPRPRTGRGGTAPAGRAHQGTRARHPHRASGGSGA